MSGVDRYAVFGNPIEQSRSPEIHAAFAAATGQALSYDRCAPAIDGFNAAAEQFFAGGGAGLNVTMPFKQDACAFADQLTDRAKLAGAVNTLTNRNGTIVGDTTDGVGLLRDLRDNLGWPLAAQKILILGAGGAVRGVLGELLGELPQHLVIANRTVSKALDLARLFAEHGYLIGCDYTMLDGQQFDLIINASGAGLVGAQVALPDDLLLPGGRAYDLTYAGEPTPFLRWATPRATATADGLGMLVEQAAESFAIWRGVRPATAEVIAGLRRFLA